jgi:hypothetical protein
MLRSRYLNFYAYQRNESTGALIKDRATIRKNYLVRHQAPPRPPTKASKNVSSSDPRAVLHDRSAGSP